MNEDGEEIDIDLEAPSTLKAATLIGNSWIIR